MGCLTGRPASCGARKTSAPLAGELPTKEEIEGRSRAEWRAGVRVIHLPPSNHTSATSFPHIWSIRGREYLVYPPWSVRLSDHTGSGAT